MQINVYDKISNVGYVCDGDTLYTRKEMETMLDTSGLTAAQMGVLYELNHDVAMGQIEKVKEAFNELPEASLTSEARDEIRKMNHVEAFLKLLIVVQLGFAVITFAACLVADIPFRHYMTFLLLTILSYGVTLVFRFSFRNLIDEDVDDFVQQSILSPERKNLEQTIESRRAMVYSIQNTYLMYRVIGDRIGYSEELDPMDDQNLSEILGSLDREDDDCVVDKLDDDLK